MTKIKICGIRRLEDIDFLNKLQPDYAGFIFCKSKRQITMEFGKELIKNLDKNIKTVGVFQNNTLDEVKSIGETLNLDIIQLHGSENEDYIKKLQHFNVWKTASIDALNVSTQNLSHNDMSYYEEELNKICNMKVKAVLVDSSVKGNRGGTGVSFNWNILKNIHLKKPVILAGGLNCENVIEGIKIVEPYAVDISSGVEENGVKSFKKIKDLIDKVRNFKSINHKR